MNLKQSRYTLISESLDKEETLTSKRMLFSTRKGMGITVTNYVLALMEANNYAAIPDNLFNVLMYHELIVPEDEDEMDELITRNQLTSEDIQGAELSLYIDSETSLDDQLKQSLRELLAQNADDAKKTLRLTVTASSIVSGLVRLQWLDDCITALPLGSAVRKEFQLVCLSEGRSGLLEHSILEKTAIRMGKIGLVFNLVHLPAGVQPVIHELKDLQSLLGYFPTTPVEIQLLVTNNDARLPELLAEFHHLKREFAVDIVVQFVYPSEESAAKRQEQELQWLNYFGENKFALNLLPVPSHTYFSEEPWAKLSNPVPVLHLDHFSAEMNYSETTLFRKFYDQHIAELLRTHQIRCSACMYLPLCGGKADKNNDHDRDCPPFIHNFMKKVELKYNITRN